jgi:hypothetical protein
MEREWRVIGAASRSGKTRCVLYYSRVLHPTVQDKQGGTTRPVLSVLIPRGQRYAKERLRERIAWHMGAIVAKRTQADAGWIATRLKNGGTELLIVNDANRMPSEDHLPVFQEIADLYEIEAGRRLGVALLSATERGNILLRRSLEMGDSAEWAQIQGRFAGEKPFVVLSGLSLEEVRSILHTYDGALTEHFPGLSLVRWTNDIYEYLRLPALAPDGVAHVRMGSVVRFVDGILRRIVARDLVDIDPEGDIIQEVGQALTTAPEAREMADVYFDGESVR